MSLQEEEVSRLNRKETYEQKTWDLMIPIAEELKLTVVDTEFTKEGEDYALTVYIDKDGGVQIEDCEHVSGLLNPALDETDFISEPYTLYVSSPGLGRPLKRPRDFEWAKGKRIEIHTYKAIDKKKDFTGILTDFTETTVTIAPGESEEVTLSRSDISLIRLAFDF